ncbi:c-type cytochrome [Parahaliea mediterranea]|uniref:c-type cytochrome n=1 Tax=Parahaliea mediterranea TaxID=651086 RepID=UPI000E2F9BA3|nr:c-type cytochrome [Parahaliea mediterranea]
MMQWIVIPLMMAMSALPAFAERIYEQAEPPKALTEEQADEAAANYQKYCALCHGADRQGHVNDHAPSLRSPSLMATGVPMGLALPISYGRLGTPMAGYLDEVGGPMTLEQIKHLTYWLFQQSGLDHPLKLSREPVAGDAQQGKSVYAQHCATCHGSGGEGVTAPALSNASALAHNTDEFIRYAIEFGREGTPMPSFGTQLSAADIDNVTAFIRSWAAELAPEKTVLQALPTPDEYVLNPQGEDPDFELMDGQYVSSESLFEALQANKRMILLDTRAVSAWQRAHIAGSIPFPYYSELEDKTQDLPKDVMIVAYCACPRAAADYVVKQLGELGYTRTAVLYEGIFGWMNQGYPYLIAGGETTTKQ